jgi:Fe-coproporphyrin III synthase
MAYRYNRKTGFSKTAQFFYFAFYRIKSSFSARYRTPLLCSFKITGRCNLKCSHCPFWREDTCGEMDFNRVCKILEELHKKGVKIIIFEGGEPLLWKDEKSGKNISDVLQYAKNMFFYCGITTNGTVNLDIVQSNADVVFVSVDGIGKTHDSIRGKSFDRLVKNLVSHKKKSKIIANICISKTNSHEIEDLVNFLNDMVYGITVQFFYPYKNVADVMLPDKEKEVVLKKLVKLKKKGYRILNSQACLMKMSPIRWRCTDFLVCSVDKTGSISFGCYLKNKVDKAICAFCGFTVHCEISLAYRLNFSALSAAVSIFWSRKNVDLYACFPAVLSFFGVKASISFPNIPVFPCK